MEVYDWLWIWKTPRTRPEIVKKYLCEGRLETLFRICSSFEMLSQKVAVIHCGPHQFHQIHHHQRLQQHHHRRRDVGVVVINTLIIIAFFYHYYCCQDSVNWCPTHAIETGRDRGGDWDLVTRYALSRLFRFLRPVGPGLAWLANWRPLNLGTRYGSVPGTPRELENDRWPI